ncbi:MAG: DNA glycosylase [Clostridia bacterium]
MLFDLTNDILSISDMSEFNLERSANCGQAFRFNVFEDGYEAVILGRRFVFRKKGDILMISNCKQGDAAFFSHYLDLDTDYKKIELWIEKDPVLSPCLPYARGIRVFNQEPFETLISFIISANSNIGKIKRTIEKLSAMLGAEIATGYFAFPTAEAIAESDEAKLSAIGAGYRVPYIIKTARAIVSGFSLETIRDIPTDQARKQLCTLMGVGPKVADCVLLFSLSHRNAFPMDVWMKRAVRALYFKGTDEPDKKSLEEVITSLGDEAGIIQQYIFHYARENKIGA